MDLQPDTCATLALSDVRTIATSDETLKILRDSVRQELALDIDCTALTAVDLSFLQMLLATKRALAAAGRHLTVRASAGGVLERGLAAGGFLGTSEFSDFVTFSVNSDEGCTMAKTVLTVDDSASMRQLVKLTLGGAGYSVVEASDGLDGLDRARAATVDLVVTDLNMPKMDGIAMIRELRKLGSYKGVPIILLTTESDDDRKKEARAAGATGWITKPFNQDQLLGVVKKVLGA